MLRTHRVAVRGWLRLEHLGAGGTPVSVDTESFLPASLPGPVRASAQHGVSGPIPLRGPRFLRELQKCGIPLEHGSHSLLRGTGRGMRLHFLVVGGGGMFQKCSWGGRCYPHLGKCRLPESCWATLPRFSGQLAPLPPARALSRLLLSLQASRDFSPYLKPMALLQAKGRFPNHPMTYFPPLPHPLPEALV